MGGGLFITDLGFSAANSKLSALSISFLCSSLEYPTQLIYDPLNSLAQPGKATAWGVFLVPLFVVGACKLNTLDQSEENQRNLGLKETFRIKVASQGCCTVAAGMQMVGKRGGFVVSHFLSHLWLSSSSLLCLCPTAEPRLEQVR